MMASTNKGRVIHRETFQNSNQMVEVLIRTKPKSINTGALGQKKSQFKRDCPLRKQLEQITEESSPSLDPPSQRVSGSKKQDNQSAAKKLSSDMVVEVSKNKNNSSKKNSVLSHDRTWSDVFKSYSSIREDDSVIESTTSGDVSGRYDTDHVPSKGPKTMLKRDAFPATKRTSRSQENRSVQTSQVRHFKESSAKAFQIDRPSFTDRETTVPLHMQVLNENFENIGQNQQVLQRMYQSEQEMTANQALGQQRNNHQLHTGPPLSNHLSNADIQQEQVDGVLLHGSFPKPQNSCGKLPTAEEARLLSDGLSTTPFSDSALQLLQQLRQKLHLRGDSESSEMLGVLEQFFVSGAPAVRRVQPQPSSPDPSLCNTVFNTPSAPPSNTNVHSQPIPIHQPSVLHHQPPYQLPHVSNQPNIEYGHYAAHAQQHQHGVSSAYPTQYPQQSHTLQRDEVSNIPPQYVEQLRRQLSEQQLVAQQQAATIAELRSLSSRLLALHGKATENPTFQSTVNPQFQQPANPMFLPTANPAFQPTANPAFQPTANPTILTTTNTTTQTTANPTVQTTANPIVQTTANPILRTAANPTNQTTANPTIQTTANSSFQSTTNPTFQTTVNPTAQTSQNQAVHTTQVPASSVPLPTISSAATVCSTLGHRPFNTSSSSLLQPSHSALPGTSAPQREDGSSRATLAAPITQHPSHPQQSISVVHKESVNPQAAVANNGSRAASTTRGVTFGTLPRQHALEPRTDEPNTRYNSISTSEHILGNGRDHCFVHGLLPSHGNIEEFNLDSRNMNRAPPPNGSSVEHGKHPDQLPSAGWVTHNPPGDRGHPIPLPSARGIPSSSLADDRMQRAALWSMHCENEMLKRQLREAGQPTQSSQAATPAEAVASSPSDMPQQQPFTSTRKSPPITRPLDDPVGDSDSAFDERTSSKFGSKRPSPSEGIQPLQFMGLSSVPHGVPHSDASAFRVTNTLPNVQGFVDTRSTFRSTAPQMNVAATGVDTDMLRTTQEQQQTTLNPAICNASTIPNTVLRDRQQPSPLGSPSSSSAGPLASNESSSDTSTGHSVGELTNLNHMNLGLSAVGQHVPARLKDVEPPSEFLLSTLSALSEDEQSLASSAGNHFVSKYISGKTKTSTPSERSVNSSGELARPAAQFSASSSTISSCSMAQSIARQSQDGETPLIVPRPLESTRLQETQARGFSQATDRNSLRSSKSSATSVDARNSRRAAPGRRDFEASSRFQTLTPEEDSSVDTLT